MREQLQLKKTNALQALYPSCKFLIVCLYSLCSIILGTIKVNGYAIWLIPCFFVLPLLCLASGVLKRFFNAFSKAFFIAAIVFVVQALLIPSPVVLARLGPIKVYEGGLQSGLVLAFSICNIAGIFIWMFQTTENKEISRALEDSGLNYKAAYVFMSTLQMIKVLGHNSNTIMNAQRARGVETEGNLLVRAKAFFPSLVPLILGSITSAEERVLTLESKGFDVNGPKTHLFELKKSGYEKTAATTAIVITAAILIWRILLWVL